jgi:hypothetical protein
VGLNLKLHLGVLQTQEWGNSQWDTYDVAKHLEEAYGLYSAFAEYEGQKMADYLADSVAGSIETILQGGVSKDPFASGTAKITQDFREFISSQTAEKVLAPGTDARPVPTKAALVGRSKRKARPYAKGDRRPSFIDSGIFEKSIKTWVEK